MAQYCTYFPFSFHEQIAYRCADGQHGRDFRRVGRRQHVMSRNRFMIRGRPGCSVQSYGQWTKGQSRLTLCMIFACDIRVPAWSASARCMGRCQNWGGVVETGVFHRGGGLSEVVVTLDGSCSACIRQSCAGQPRSASCGSWGLAFLCLAAHAVDNPCRTGTEMRGAADWGSCPIGVACDIFFGCLLCKHETVS
jgi:hypothetical protein